MKKIILLFLIVTIFSNESFSQSTRYIIRFKDKGTNPFTIANPAAYLTNRAIQRRTRYNIAIDSTDLPITARYIDSVRLAGAVIILTTSKWLNQVAIQTTDAAALAKINTFPFVLSTAPIAAKPVKNGASVNKKLDTEDNHGTNDILPQNLLTDYYNYGQSFGQVHIHNGEFLHNRGFRGEGMQLAILDAGFFHYLSLPTFDSIRNNNQVLGTWDFVTNNASVDEDHPHGMNCLSIIAANMPGVFMGTAPKTSFYLYRTEDAATEYPIEEQNWANGIERADSLGVDICSTSLGYSTFDDPSFNHSYADMNGNTTIIAKAADMAAKKGMLIVIAAGNEGGSSWHYITTPADADSAMAVGAVSTSGAVAGFSSFGPSSDGQVKPAVAAVGVSAVIANTSNGQPTFGNGTSFACPNMAGLTTCLWQAFPEVNNMGIINTLQQSASRASNPDDRVGYGIPNMKKAFVMLEKQLYTQQIAMRNCKAELALTAKTDSVISIVVERKLLTDINYIPVGTLSSTGGFALRNFNYSDDLSATTGTVIKYRLKMNIAADTSFYLDSLSVNFVPKPNFGADKFITRCSDSSLNLTGFYNTSGLTASWTLNGNPVTNPAVVSASGIYQLTGSNTSGCSDTALVTVNFITRPNLGADKLAVKCPDSSFNLTTLFGTTGLTATWSIAGVPVGNPSAVSTAGIYQLTVVNSSGCSDTALLTLTNDAQFCSPLIEKIIISPNPVTDNLSITIAKRDAVKIEINIHNASGQKMYSINSQQAAGSQLYIVPMKSMAAGIYYVNVFINGKEQAVKKIMKR
jgi:serine protease AprX